MRRKQRKNRLVTRTTPFLIAHTVVTVQNVVTFRWLKNILSSFCGSSFFLLLANVPLWVLALRLPHLFVASLLRDNLRVTTGTGCVCVEKRCVNITFDGANAKRLFFFFVARQYFDDGIYCHNHSSHRTSLRTYIAFFHPFAFNFLSPMFAAAFTDWHWCARFAIMSEGTCPLQD